MGSMNPIRRGGLHIHQGLLNLCLTGYGVEKDRQVTVRRGEMHRAYAVPLA